MTIADQLIDINNSKQAIKTSIEAKGVSVGTAPFSDYASKIDLITGGSSEPQPIPWVRPSNWIANPAISAGQQKVQCIGLINDTIASDQVITLQCRAAYTVDWGDGTTENFGDNVRATHTYVYANISNDNLLTTGTKQVLITITPNGGNLTLVNLLSNVGNTSNKFLEIKARIPNATSGLNICSATSTNFASSLVNVEVDEIPDGANITCQYAIAMQQIKVPSTWNPGALTDMFTNCKSLVNAPMMVTSNRSGWSNMFLNCAALRYVPAYNALAATTMASMFSGCSSLTYIPAMTTTSALTNLDSFCLNCSSLTTVPLFETSGVTNITQMFNGCPNLETVAELNVSAVTSAGTSTQYVFGNCYKLKAIPDSFASLPATLTQCRLISGCNSIRTIPAFTNTSQWTNLGANGFCNENHNLRELPSLDLSGVTTAFNTAASMFSLERSRLYNVKVTHKYAPNKLSRQALEEIFENLGTPATTQTITITSNIGAPAAISRAATLTAGNQTIAITNTAGITIGTQVTGTGINDAVSVTFTDAGDTVNRTAHGLTDGKRVSFATIVTTTGISVYVPYYVVNATSDNFQLSLTQGGAPIALTSNGSGTMLYMTLVTGVVTNTSVTVDIAPTGSGTQTLAWRDLNSMIAVMKRWTVA